MKMFASWDHKRVYVCSGNLWGEVGGTVKFHNKCGGTTWFFE